MNDRHQTRLGQQNSLLSKQTVRRVTAVDLGLPLPAENTEAGEAAGEWEQLQDNAEDVAGKASDEVWQIGCAVLTDSGSMYASAPVRIGDEVIHAVRGTVVKAASEGDTAIEKLVVFASDAADPNVCGACCHTLYEVAGSDVELKLVTDDQVQNFTLQELYPYP